MTNVAHKDIADPNRHEPKGISTATSGQVYVADGSASGAWTAASSPSEVLLKSVTASGAASVTFENGVSSVVFNSTYPYYRVRFSGVRGSIADSYILLNVGTGGGPAYQTSSYQFAVNYWAIGSAGSSGASSSSAGAFPINYAFTTGAGLSTSSSFGMIGELIIPDPTTSVIKHIYSDCSYINNGSNLAIRMQDTGFWSATTALTGLKFTTSSGTITGKFSLYGITG